MLALERVDHLCSTSPYRLFHAGCSVNLVGSSHGADWCDAICSDAKRLPPGNWHSSTSRLPVFVLIRIFLFSFHSRPAVGADPFALCTEKILIRDDLAKVNAQDRIEGMDLSHHSDCSWSH